MGLIGFHPKTQKHEVPSAVLNVFLTVDTEFWPRRAYRGPVDYRDDFLRDIYGHTKDGDFGLRFQSDLLNAHGLHAVFMVEALCAHAVGLEPLKEIVQLVQTSGHDVQLHLHPEWLSKMPEPLLPGRTARYMHEFSEDEQTVLIANGLAKLKECGANGVCAFRAGNYGANLGTLRALARNRIMYDTSHNTCYLDAACDMPTERPLFQPREMFGVVEFPVTFFRDFLRRNRPLQLAACSSGEIENVVWQAWRRGWSCVVIVSHSFELIRGRTCATDQPRADGIALRRFTRLCRFLHQHQDKFRTSTFSELGTADVPSGFHSEPLNARMLDTSIRLAQQAFRRVRK